MVRFYSKLSSFHSTSLSLFSFYTTFSTMFRYSTRSASLLEESLSAEKEFTFAICGIYGNFENEELSGFLSSLPCMPIFITPTTHHPTTNPPLTTPHPPPPAPTTPPNKQQIKFEWAHNNKLQE